MRDVANIVVAHEARKRRIAVAKAEKNRRLRRMGL
jgi:hypothetical protein